MPFPTHYFCKIITAIECGAIMEKQSISARGRIHVRSVITDDFSWLCSFFLRRIIDTRSIILASHSLDQWLYFLVGRRHAQWCRRYRLFVWVIHEGSSFSFAEAECCVGEAASEACWEPCYCVLLQDEQTLTAYRSEDMAVSTFFSKSLSDSPGFIYPAALSSAHPRHYHKAWDGFIPLLLHVSFFS